MFVKHERLQREYIALTNSSFPLEKKYIQLTSKRAIFKQVQCYSTKAEHISIATDVSPFSNVQHWEQTVSALVI